MLNFKGTKMFCWWLYLTTIIFIVDGQKRNYNSALRDSQPPKVSYVPKEEQMSRENKAKLVQKYMNLSVDPCNDFYEFACGKWNEAYKGDNNDDEVVITHDYLMEQEILDNLQSLLVQPPSGQNTLSGQKIRHFYESCIQEAAFSPSQHKFFMDFIRKHDGLPYLVNTNWNPRYSWESVVSDLRASYGMEILIGLKVEPNVGNARGGGGYSVYIDEPTLTILPEDLCSAEAWSNADIYEQFHETIEEEVAKNLGIWFKLREADTRRIAGDIVRFEFELCKGMRKDQFIEDEEEEQQELGQDESAERSAAGRMPSRTGQLRLHKTQRKETSPYVLLNLQQLTKEFNQNIDFVHYVNSIFPKQFNNQVYLRSKAYFANLAPLVKITQKPTLAYYIMYNAISVLSFPSDDRAKGRPEFCAKLAIQHFPQHFGQMYYQKYYRDFLKHDIENIYQRIKETFADSFNVEWLSNNLKRAAQQKLALFKVRFPAYENLDLRELVVDELTYWEKLEHIMNYNAERDLSKLFDYANRESERMVEAYDVDLQLEPRENELQIGLGLLKQPLYHHYFYGNSLKYSLVGQILARTLISVFDEQGWNKDPQSSMRWDERTTQGFRNISQCFRTQFSNYLYNNPDDFRNAFKLREFMADSSGLSIAFKAYLLWLRNIDHRERSLMKETLPDVNFTNTQLFFINFAQIRCATTINSEQENVFPIDWHTEERFSVNGPLSNFDEFAREFNCAPGTEMNPDDKCVLY